MRWVRARRAGCNAAGHRPAAAADASPDRRPAARDRPAGSAVPAAGPGGRSAATASSRAVRAPWCRCAPPRPVWRQARRQPAQAPVRRRTVLRRRSPAPRRPVPVPPRAPFPQRAWPALGPGRPKPVRGPCRRLARVAVRRAVPRPRPRWLVIEQGRQRGCRRRGCIRRGGRRVRRRRRGSLRGARRHRLAAARAGLRARLAGQVGDQEVAVRAGGEHARYSTTRPPIAQAGWSPQRRTPSIRTQSPSTATCSSSNHAA
jgi:hypothetical protein